MWPAREGEGEGGGRSIPIQSFKWLPNLRIQYGSLCAVFSVPFFLLSIAACRRQPNKEICAVPNERELWWVLLAVTYFSSGCFKLFSSLSTDYVHCVMVCSASVLHILQLMTLHWIHYLRLKSTLKDPQCTCQFLIFVGGEYCADGKCLARLLSCVSQRSLIRCVTWVSGISKSLMPLNWLVCQERLGFWIFLIHVACCSVQ